MMVYLWILTLTVCLTKQATGELEIITVDDKNEHEFLREVQYSHKYLIELPATSKLIVKVEEIDLKTTLGDYILIKRGPELGSEGTGMVLSGKVIPDKPLFISSNKVFIEVFCAEIEEEEHKSDKIIRKFRLKLQAHGKSIISTTEGPPTTPKWPTPGQHDKIHYKAHLYGMRDIDFIKQRNALDELRLAISKMAIAYCQDQAFPLAEEIKSNNVLIADLVRCPFQWPDSEKCVEVNFAVPVIMKEGYKGYELLAKHLEVMWQRYNSILLENGFRNYIIEDIEGEVALWDATFITCFVLAILGIIVTSLLWVCRPKCLLKLFGGSKKFDNRTSFVQHEVRHSIASNESEFDRFRADAHIS